MTDIQKSKGLTSTVFSSSGLVNTPILLICANSSRISDSFGSTPRIDDNAFHTPPVYQEGSNPTLVSTVMIVQEESQNQLLLWSAAALLIYSFSRTHG